MKKLLQLIFLLTICNSIKAQVGINTTTPHPSTILDIESDNKGVLLNRVQLSSKLDESTILNPTKGLLVINTNNAGEGVNKVYKDVLYHYNGHAWEEIFLNSTNYNNLLYPKVAAIGRKTNETSCTNLNNGTFDLDPSTFILNEGNILNPDGSITVAKSGFYSWSIQLVQKMKRNAYKPYFTPGMVTYVFRIGSTTVESDHYFSYSGSVYLEEGSTSFPFTWHLGDNTSTEKCSENDRIGKQIVVWKFLGE